WPNVGVDHVEVRRPRERQQELPLLVVDVLLGRPRLYLGAEVARQDGDQLRGDPAVACCHQGGEQPGQGGLNSPRGVGGDREPQGGPVEDIHRCARVRGSVQQYASGNSSRTRLEASSRKAGSSRPAFSPSSAPGGSSTRAGR